MQPNVSESGVGKTTSMLPTDNMYDASVEWRDRPQTNDLFDNIAIDDDQRANIDMYRNAVGH